MATNRRGLFIKTGGSQLVTFVRQINSHVAEVRAINRSSQLNAVMHCPFYIIKKSDSKYS